MVMDMSKVTSKTSSLKALVLKAWRERWTDLQWGINIKTILPRGISGDVYNLADCILQQAVTGSGLNQLLLSYLKHSLSAQLVSYAVVIKQISKFDQFHKPHCVYHFLEFFESFQEGITCRSKPEETLMPTSIILLTNWLLKVCNYFMFQTQNSNFITLTSEIITKKAAKNLQFIAECDFLSAMFHLGRFVEKDVFMEILDIINEIENGIKMKKNDDSMNMEKILQKLKSCIEIECKALNEYDQKRLVNNPINYSIQILLTNLVVHQSILSTEQLINEMLLIKKLNNYTFVQLYYEIMRCSLLSLNNACGTAYEKIWGGFVFIYIPKLLRRLYSISLFLNAYYSERNNYNYYDQKEPNLNELFNVNFKMDDLSVSSKKVDNYSEDVVKAIESFLKHSDLLNSLDVKCSCNCLEYLLNELQKVHLINDTYNQYFINLRQGYSVLKLDVNINRNPGIRKFIVKADQSLNGILKSLNSDHGKMHEALSGMLSQVLTAKSLDLILAVARVDGKLKTFVSKLIKFNESAIKQIDLNSCLNKSSPSFSKAILFDVSFLILCSIVQNFGSKVISEENADTFFYEWFQKDLNNTSEEIPPDDLLKYSDKTKVDLLIQYFLSSNTNEMDSILQMKWHHVLFNLPEIIKQILFAWEQGSLLTNDVKKFLDSLRRFKHCSIVIVTSSWLCSYMKTVNQDLLLKPMNMLQELMTSFVPANSTTEDKINSVEYLKDRLNLMREIVRKMQKGINSSSLQTNETKFISNESISQFWNSIYDMGYIDNETSVRFKNIFETSSCYMFVSEIIKEVFKYSFEQELNKAVDLAFGLFCFYIEDCTKMLINEILPLYLFNKNSSEILNEPQTLALSKLTVNCIYVAVEINIFKSNINEHNAFNRKRSYQDSECNDDYQIPVTKMMKLNDNTSIKLEGSSSSNYNTNTENAILTCLRQFFQNYELIILQNRISISKQTNFLIVFLKMIVKYASNCKNVILKNISNLMIPIMLKSMPELFSYDFLLELYDKNTLYGISNASRDVCLLRSYNLKKCSNFF